MRGKMFLRLFVRRVLAGSCFVLLVWPVAAQDILTLEIDRAKIVELPAGTNTLVIGNPGIADATVLRRQNRIVLTARAYGQTNMIALDTRGQALAEAHHLCDEARHSFSGHSKRNQPATQGLERPQARSV
jgi:Flp pilus assembly secretin CpaC